MEFTLDKNNIWTSSSDGSEIHYPEEGYKNLSDVENQSFWYHHRTQVINQLIHKYPFRNNFADIGGGTGYQCEQIKKNAPDKKVFLLEPGYSGCIYAVERGLKDVYNTTFDNFNFKKNKVDGLGIFDVIEHIEDDENFLNELYKKIQPGTHLYITVPSFPILWSQEDVLAKHFRRYTKSSFRKLVKKTSFKIVSQNYFFSYAFLPAYILRSKKNKSKADVSKESVKNLTRVKKNNFIITFLNFIEMQLINRVPIPFGTSQFIILKK